MRRRFLLFANKAYARAWEISRENYQSLLAELRPYLPSVFCVAIAPRRTAPSCPCQLQSKIRSVLQEATAPRGNELGHSAKRREKAGPLLAAPRVLRLRSDQNGGVMPV